MTRQLCLVEVRRLLRNPYLWVAVVAALALLVRGHWNRLPNLAEAAVNAAMASFLVAATMMVVANLATLRDQRHGMPETLAALPGQSDRRTWAVLLAAGCVGAGLSGLVIGGYLLIAALQEPSAGLVDAREVLGAMAAAAALAAAGVASGRWLPSLVTVPAALVVLGMGLVGGPLFLLVWHLPMTAPYLTQAYGRPAGPRLAYLVAGLVLLAALALLWHGGRPVRLAAAAAALAVVVPAGVAVAVTAPPRLGGVERALEFAPVDPDLACTEHSGVTFCHFPSFGSWVPVWAAAVAPTAAAIPPAGRERLPAVVQRSELHREMLVGPDAGHAVVGTVWYRGDLADYSRAGLAGQLAAEVTGLADAVRATRTGSGSIDGNSFGDPGPSPWCNGIGQARTVVALWLAGQAAPVRLQPAPLRDIGYDEPELGYAELLLARDDARELVWRHWDTLLDPSTGLDDLVPLLGLATPAPPATPVGEPACG